MALINHDKSPLIFVNYHITHISANPKIRKPSWFWIKAPNFSSKEAFSDLNWLNFPIRTLMLRCFLMYNLINDNNRKSMIMKCLDYHDSHNTRSKDTIWVIKSSNSWSLLRSVNSALPDWITLPMDIKKLPLNSFRMLLLSRFKFLK